LFFISRSFHPYFISNFWSKGRHLLDRSKFGANLNPFEIKLIRFENRIGRHCAAGPACHCRAASRSPRTPSLPTGPRARPVPPVSHSRSRRAPPATIRAARSHRTRAVLTHAAPHPGPSLSAPLRACGPHLRLDRAARPWPSRPSGRPHVVGRWAVHCSPTLCGEF
jgi:hypothetical protein